MHFLSTIREGEEDCGVYYTCVIGQIKLDPTHDLPKLDPQWALQYKNERNAFELQVHIFFMSNIF